MCKRNSPHKNEASLGEREEENPTKDVSDKLHTEIKSKHGMCKRNSPDKNKASTGFVRETPRINMKPARDV